MQPPVTVSTIRVVVPVDPPDLPLGAARGLLRILCDDLVRQRADQGASTDGREDEALAS